MAFGKKKVEQTEPKVVVPVPVGDVEKFKRLFALSTMLDKKHETTNSLMRLGARNIVRVPSINTGLPTLDYDVFGCGGLPLGRTVEIFGPESSGKTTSTLHFIAQAQQQGHIAAFVDAEHSLDTGYARNLGVNIDNLVINQPNSGEKALQVVDELVKSQCVGLIVVDSVAALVPEAELEGDMGDNHVGLQARMMSQAMRKLNAICAVNKVTVIFINQIREKIGTMYGNPETTTGGRALKFYSSIRIDVRRKEEIKVGNRLVGHQLRLKAVKNKVGTPTRETLIDLYYPGTEFPCGLDTVGDLITFASKRGLFEMSGSWYSMDLGNVGEDKKPLGVERLANGLVNLKERLRDDKKALDIIRKKVAKVAFEVAEVKA
jgi:recombination protein RecA